MQGYCSAGHGCGIMAHVCRVAAHAFTIFSGDGLMSRFHRRTRKSQAIIADPMANEPLPGLPFQTHDRRVVVASAVLRNGVAIAGVLLLGWSAPELAILYFADTLAAIWGIFTAMMYAMLRSEKQSAFDLAYSWLTALALSAVTALMIAVPLGMPVVLVVASSSWNLLAALEMQGFRLALVSVVLVGIVGAIFRSFRAAAGDAGLHAMKWEFTLVFGRWFVVIAVMYTVGFLFLRGAAVVMVIVYAVTSVVAELYPRRFVGWFDSGAKS